MNRFSAGSVGVSTFCVAQLNVRHSSVTVVRVRHVVPRRSGVRQNFGTRGVNEHRGMLRSRLQRGLDDEGSLVTTDPINECVNSESSYLWFQWADSYEVWKARK
jgi:hypothetical protein